MRHTPVIYLDQNKWIELLRAKSGAASNSVALDVLEALRTAVSEQRIVVPLSAGNYLETWHRADSESRHALAALMREISGFATILPVQHLLCLEVEALMLTQYRGINCHCQVPDIKATFVGRGVDHAFHSQTGRLRLVSRVASETATEGPNIRPDDEFRSMLQKVRQLPDDAYEWWSLAGFNQGFPSDGWDIRQEHRFGSRYANEETALADQLAADSHLRNRLDDLVCTQELVAITDTFNRIAYWHDARTGKYIDTFMREGPDFGRRFIDSLPTRACLRRLRVAKHRNPQWKWQQHDRTDLGILSAAIPYADIVVTERQWVHTAHSMKLDALFGTKVTSTLADVLTLL